MNLTVMVLNDEIGGMALAFERAGFCQSRCHQQEEKKQRNLQIYKSTKRYFGKNIPDSSYLR